MRKHLPYAIVGTLAAIILATPHLRAENSDCNSTSVTTRDFDRKPGDTVDPRHLELLRPYTGGGKLELNICNADLRIHTRPDLDHLRLVVDLGAQPSGHTAQDYIRRFRVQPDSAAIDLWTPNDAHATVTLELPMSASSENDISLGRGDLDLNTIGGAGKRDISVGMGHINLLTGGDRSYSNLAISIGMGSFHDHRPGGQSAHFAISRDDRGSGQGAVAISLGMGSLDIRE